MKTKTGRIKNTLQYIDNAVSSELAEHIVTAARQGNTSILDLSDELSLGGRLDARNDDDYDERTSQRRALRALLLCQRVYFSKTWARLQLGGTGGVPAAMTHRDAWPAATPSWEATRQATVDYFSVRSEQELRTALRMFIVTSARASDLATAATAPGDAKLIAPKLGLTRESENFPGDATCYSAVMCWMFRAGLVSYRWLLRNRAVSEVSFLKALFGPAKTIWGADKPFGAGDELPHVPNGHIVHLYVDDGGAWRGHWLVSTGNGYGFGRHNDSEAGKVKVDYDYCSLDRQFRIGYKSTTARGGQQIVQPGIAAVINPLQIPDRM